MGQPEQQQQVPGIQSEMTPVPDCGEDSYVGPVSWRARWR